MNTRLISKMATMARRTLSTVPLFASGREALFYFNVIVRTLGKAPRTLWIIGIVYPSGNTAIKNKRQPRR